jgi:hypothetical protein
MDRELASRIELLEATAAKSEKALARQRRLIEELQADGQRTADAEELLERYEASHRGLLEKLARLQHQKAAGRRGSEAEARRTGGEAAHDRPHAAT